MTAVESTATTAQEYEALRATVEEFARKEVAPVITDFYIREEFPYGLVATMGEMGLFGLPISESYGGMGGDYYALCLALEELGRVDSSVAITLEAGVSLGAMPIYRFGTDEQKPAGCPTSLPVARSARSASPSPAAAPTPAPPAPPPASTATNG